MKVKSSLNVRIFELTEFEWYGDNPEKAGDRQAAMVETVMKDAYESTCRYAVIFVTPDDLFSVSPIKGRHKVFSESLSPILGDLRVTVSANISLDKYEVASEQRKNAMLKLAEDELISLASHLPTKGVDTSYAIMGLGDDDIKVLRSFKC